MYLDFCAACNSRLVELFLPNGLNQPGGEQSHVLEMNAKIRDKRYRALSCRPRRRPGRGPSFLRVVGVRVRVCFPKVFTVILSTTLRGVGCPSPSPAARGLSSLRTNVRRGCRGSPPTLWHPCHLRTLSRRAGWEGKPTQPGGIRKTELEDPGVAKSKPVSGKISSRPHTWHCERRSVFAEVRSYDEGIFSSGGP